MPSPIKLTDESPMPVGQFKGIKLANVPAEELLWWDENAYDSVRFHQAELFDYIEDNRDSIELEIKQKQEKRGNGH